ncbi:hypothetical protein [Cryobacterium melibiosiphilum]|uniref:hypothetical protein n=1 Tax=Cryobacterium melibiosiphilum TaxID=995039 RepID=UPI0013147105|nr:hypothetical protein [Cryobacterium melibiosiphilum]
MVAILAGALRAAFITAGAGSAGGAIARALGATALVAAGASVVSAVVACVVGGRS